MKNMLEEVKKCHFCQNSGEELSLFSANHKELGWIKVCRDCWVTLYEKNSMIAGSSGSSTPSSPCSSCSGCCF